ncbi:MAG TPA: UDP-N-acetylmuramyl-tripeptide synthetase [Isosphaeraceae bacterium]|jgi:UDP-N-acetylmuramoyl-L-alanyl-D-glutamate--2,6-diaminopimelate ligase|nr:UDP-N-acetylmuramyl-tripeptide synthetase [Isosphaeraceae bacterium]
MARWFVDRSPQRGIPSVSLRRLLPDATFVGCSDLEVSGCSADSRRLDPGQVFVAVRGSRHDGHRYVADAVERGAVAVIVEHPCPEAGPLQVIVPDARLALARLSQALAGDPSERLRIVGVTGSTGATAASLFLRAIFEAAGGRFGLVGPSGWSDGVEHRPGPDLPRAEDLARMLSAMVERGCAGGIVEVPEEALARRDCEGIRFDAVLVTDLQGSPREPDEARILRRSRTARLCRRLVPGGLAIVNADDPDAELLGAVKLDARRLSFSLAGAGDVNARIDRIDADGALVTLTGLDRNVTVSLGLIGRRHVGHALAAAALAWSRGMSDEAIVAGLEAVRVVPGRLEEVAAGQDFLVRVDRARTGLELGVALEAVRESVSGRLICVLGGDGHQGLAHRLALAEAAEAGADQVILTTGSPRGEDPDRILDDLLAGFARPGRIRIEADRRVAIEAALATAGAGDAVLIAGRGSQPYQIFDTHAVPFDDRGIATRWLLGQATEQRRSA